MASRYWIVEFTSDDNAEDLYLCQPEYYLESSQGGDVRGFIVLNGPPVTEEVLQDLGAELNFNIAQSYSHAVAFVREWPILKEWGIAARDDLEIAEAANEAVAQLIDLVEPPEDENKFQPVYDEVYHDGPVIRVLTHADGEIMGGNYVPYFEMDDIVIDGNLEAFEDRCAEHMREFGPR